MIKIICGECNAYEIILEQLENIMKAEGISI